MKNICRLILTSLFFLKVDFAVIADSLRCDLSQYRSQPGLSASVEGEQLRVTWEGAGKEEVRLRFGINDGMPVVQEMAIRSSGGKWKILATNLVPEFRVVSGVRRVTMQQTEPLEELGVPLTAEKLNEIKWEAFWDAPLYIDDEPAKYHASAIPPAEAFANHPGMPRKPEEVVRATAEYKVKGCRVTTNGARLEIVFEGVKAGIFDGFLQFDVFKGSNLVRQMLVAKTDHPSAAFKFDAGLKGFPVKPSSSLIWRDLAGNQQEYHFGAPANQVPVIVRSNNRLIAAEFDGGSVAFFPPPHSFYWARESEKNLGYGWYRKDDDGHFSFGIRQAEHEEEAEFYHNFALYSARPGTWQRMPVFFYLHSGTGSEVIGRALEFTRGDQFKSLPGFKVMGHHYHVGMAKRLQNQEQNEVLLNDVLTMKSVGIDIFGVIDGVRGPARHDRGMAFVDALHEYYEQARRQSDHGFLLMPNDENSTGGRPPFLGGHYDIIISKPTYWKPSRQEGEPLYQTHPKYGDVYNIATPADMMAMCERENALISIPHPRSKGSTGFPDAIRDEPHFLHPHYFGLGYRWGMGIDGSETRLGEYRFLNMWDEVNNWMAAKNLPPKYAIAISEARSDIGDRGKPPYDDTYGMSPVNYLKIDQVPTVDDMSSIVNALKNGEYFMTSGEVLIPFFEVQGKGNKRKLVAEVEWTFPLDLVELVWGDGERTDRQVISTTDLPPFGKKRFEIPFDAKGKSWVRFAAWDVATNGAMLQPVHLK